ncbi:glycosyltransferase family 4 protein [Cohnella yongneupensis]|uniref:Glycosyltransferase family 4 protein n=1 Tax=Cohnella yongneupensis TaxID=425006 RepID=A0ABW0R6Z9_9BACL
MNVLMICTEKLPVPNIRGGAIQTYICGVAPLISQKHRLTIMGRTDPDLPDSETVDGIRYVRVRSDDSFELYTQNVFDYLKSTKEKYDVIHMFNRPKLVDAVREAAPHARLFLSMHNDMFKLEKITFEDGVAAIEQLEKIITISNYIGRTICEYFPEAAPKVRTIYSGVDLSRFTPWLQSDTTRQARDSLREQYDLTGKKVILFVGRLTRNKGPHVLIKALEYIRHEDAVLVIVGGTWYHNETAFSDYVSYMRALAARASIPVIMTGYVPAHEVHRWFYAGDVFVCTSIWEEPLARVHFEAMATGLPFLTTARGGNPEVIQTKNGILVHNPNDPEEYAKNLNFLLSNLDLAREMGMRGRQLVERHFTWERVAREIMESWETMPARRVVKLSELAPPVNESKDAKPSKWNKN